MKKRCPICGKVVKAPESVKGPAKKNYGFFPFCSERCKLIDLGAWFDAKYRIPGKRQGPDENNSES